MDVKKYIYVAACVFTREEPELSVKIQDYLQQRFQMRIARCCTANYKDFTPAMPEWLRQRWRELPEHADVTENDTMVYVCHNCAAIFQEARPEIGRLSLWELVAGDEAFPFPDRSGERIALQDCWRSYDNRSEQEAVRVLLRKMKADIVELEERHEETQFCGISLYMPAPKRNLELAPKRFVKNACGKFMQHTKEEQVRLMREHCGKIPVDAVTAYCHYCVKGLRVGGKPAVHLTALLFGAN